MGSAAAWLRAVVIAAMEGSSAGRYVVTVSSTPTARAFMVMEAAGIGCRGLAHDPQAARPHGDGESSRTRALSLLAAYEGSPQIPPCPRALPLVGALAGEGSASEFEITPRPRAYHLSPRPRAFSLLAARLDGEDNNYLLSITEIAGSRPRHLLWEVPGDGSGSGGHHIVLPSGRPKSSLSVKVSTIPYSPIFRAATSAGPLGLGCGPKSSLFAKPSTIPRSPIIQAVTSAGPLGFGLKRVVNLRPFQCTGRRSYSDGYCWTPWNPKRPNNPQFSTTPKGLKDIIEMLKTTKLNDEEKAKLKEFLLDMFYTENEDPEGTQLKLDLILHNQALTNRMVKDIEAKVGKKWSFTGWAKDLASLIAHIISMFG